MKPKSKPGRPINPYLLNCWQPKGTASWFIKDHVAALGTDKPRTIVGTGRLDIRWWVYNLIRLLQVPVLRRVIEAILVFEQSYDPYDVTKALDTLMNHDFLDGNHIFKQIFEYGSEKNHLYTFQRKPTQTELSYLRAFYHERNQVFTKNVLRTAGEQYFRAVLIRSKKYKNITQAKQLGKVMDSDANNALDITATSKKAGKTYGISVKNQREWMHSGDKAIRDCYTKAKAHGVSPWLVAPFVAKSGIDRCNQNGIRLTVLGRQIVPAEDKKHRPMRTVINRLGCVLGPQPFEYAYNPIGRTFSRSADARKDVANVVD